MAKADVYDVAIIGGGPAGLSCAIWLGRYLRTAVVIDAGDPRNWESTGVNGYLGLPRVRPAELRERGREELGRYRVDLVDTKVLKLKRDQPELFVVSSADGSSYKSRRVMLAIGMVDVWPDCPGLEHCYGLSAHHCPDCDGYEARGKKVVILGYGRKVGALALALSNWTPEVVICTNGKAPDMPAGLIEKLDDLNIPIVQPKVKWAHSENRFIKFLELENGMQIDAEKLFFAVEHLPADDLGVQLGCKHNEDGLIVVDDAMRTSVEHVYAAGDITPGPQMAIRAAAEGSIAAAAIHRSLLPESRRL